MFNYKLGGRIYVILVIALMFLFLSSGCEKSKGPASSNNIDGTITLEATVVGIPLDGIIEEKRGSPALNKEKRINFARILKLRSDDSKTYTVYLNNNYPAEDRINAGDKVRVYLTKKADWAGPLDNIYIGTFGSLLYEGPPIRGEIREVPDYSSINSIDLAWIDKNLVRVTSYLKVQTSLGRCIVYFNEPQLWNSFSEGAMITFLPKGMYRDYEGELRYYKCKIITQNDP